MRLRFCALAVAFATGAAIATGCTDSLESLHYHVTGGFSGAGDGTELTLDLRTGALERQTRARGAERAVLPAAELAQLRQQIDDAELSTSAEYACACADAFRAQIEVRAGGATRAVAIDDTAERPPPIDALLTHVRTIAEGAEGAAAR